MLKYVEKKFQPNNHCLVPKKIAYLSVRSLFFSVRLQPKLVVLQLNCFNFNSTMLIVNRDRGINKHEIKIHRFAMKLRSYIIYKVLTTVANS